MYSRQEISKQKQAFWTTFGRYMKPVCSADGAEISWSNYHTGIKGIDFKMDADSQKATLGIIIFNSDRQLQQLYYERFVQLRHILVDTLGEDDWSWRPDTVDEYGRTVSMIGKVLTGVNILQNADWPAIISFLKPRIIALDECWSMIKYGFDDLL